MGGACWHRAQRVSVCVEGKELLHLILILIALVSTQ